VKVRFIQGLSLVCLAGTLLAAVSMAGPPPPGVSDTPLERGLVAIFALAVGFGFAGGMLYYGRVYVARVTYDVRERRFLLTTLGPPPRHLTCTEADLGGQAEYHEGHFETGRQVVNAPWYTLRLPGLRPLILDPQGEVEDAELWERLTQA